MALRAFKWFGSLGIIGKEYSMNKLIVSLVAGVICANLFADVSIPADKSKFKIVVLAGQSNMAGRGIPTDADKVAHPRVVMMDKDGNWVPCVDPIHFDKADAGVGPGKTFAEALADSDPSITVGVVPCAVGGTSVALWVPGAEWTLWNKTVRHLHEEAVGRAKKAMERGTLTAILWHQGESDCMRRNGYVYQARFPLVIEGFRRELGADGVPFICGSLFPELAKGWFGKIQCNTQRWACEYAYGPGKFVMCPEDCRRNADNIHFTRDSQVEFGRRYFAAYQEVVKALAENKDYWKDPNSDAAKIKAYPIPGWGNPNNDDNNQMGAVPDKLPEIVEKWLFPNGRPVKTMPAAEGK